MEQCLLSQSMVYDPNGNDFFIIKSSLSLAIHFYHFHPHHPSKSSTLESAQAAANISIISPVIHHLLHIKLGTNVAATHPSGLPHLPSAHPTSTPSVLALQA
jgi:hypothetical protein